MRGEGDGRSMRGYASGERSPARGNSQPDPARRSWSSVPGWPRLRPGVSGEEPATRALATGPSTSRPCRASGLEGRRSHRPPLDPRRGRVHRGRSRAPTIMRCSGHSGRSIPPGPTRGRRRTSPGTRGAFRTRTSSIDLESRSSSSPQPGTLQTSLLAGRTKWSVIR